MSLPANYEPAVDEYRSNDDGLISFMSDGQTLLRRFAYVAMWLLPIMAFTTPSKGTFDGWETLDIIKLFVLAFACFGGFYVILRNASHHRFNEVVDPLIPFFVFFAFALISVIWSPLRSVTVFQSGSLVTMLMYATGVAILCARPSETSRILLHLCLVLMTCSCVILLVYFWDPILSGLDRDLLNSGGDGIVHPTASGGTASLGLLLTIVCHRIGGYIWAKRLVVPAIVIHGAILLLSNSRTATGMAVFTILGVIFWYSSNQRRAIAAFTFAVFAILIIVVDPGLELIGSTLGASAEYVRRGQSADQLSGVSGRSEMWSAIWNEYQKSMMLGHGYFVTSAKGALFVWNKSSNFTAHNMILQVLVSTGAIGLILFFYALLQPLLCTLLLLKGSEFHRRLLGITVVISVWFFGWSMLSISFMGPIRPESIVFFTLMGVAIGQASQIQVSHDAAQTA
ncbi:MAG: O-antigen ligase family protein [Rubripirellula sp.]